MWSTKVVSRLTGTMDLLENGDEASEVSSI